MSLKFFRRATFLCPASMTGGPEAMHQVAQVFRRHGLPTDIAYTGEGAHFEFARDRVVCTPPTVNPCLEGYAHYEPVVSTGFLRRRHHLVVLPEVQLPRISLFDSVTVAVWWLSVDNGVQHLDAVTRTQVFGGSVRHFHQSAYAAQFLADQGVASDPLGDFLDHRHVAAGADGPGTDPAIAYNPVKGAEFAAEFFAGAPDLTALPLRGMTPTELSARLGRTTVYVDFGHFPGKDRLPREAAANGAVVFVRAEGAGAFHEDFPVPDRFRFTVDDIRSGALADRVRAVQADPHAAWGRQEGFRAAIAAERDVLDQQVARLRSGRQAA